MRRVLTTLPLLALATTACDLAGTYTMAPVWELESMTASQTRAAPGDPLSLTWSYTTDDVVAVQELCFLYMYFDGLGERCVELDADQREYGWVHEDAVTMLLKAENEDGDTVNGALEVHDLEDSYMRATVAVSHYGLPYLGSQADIEFSQFVGIYDDDGDARIDGLLPLMGRNNYEFFRATTDPANLYQAADGTFTAYQGPWFPFAFPLYPSQGYSNLVVYGGAIAITGGTEGTYKAADGTEGTFYTAPELYFDPIFVQLTYQYGPETKNMTATDIQVGNLNQGLVLGITSTTQLGSFGTPHNAEVVHTAEGQVRVEGSLKHASVGHSIVPNSSNIAVNVSVELDTVEWSMPLHDDHEVGQERFFQLLQQAN